MFDRVERIRGKRITTLALGVLVALATWFVTLNYPIPGLDPSWRSGLYMAVHDGIGFGNDVVFTYGPLGFLIDSTGWYQDLATVAFLWLALVHVAFACALVWAIRRSFGAIAATLIAFIVVGLLPAIEVLFALAALACFAVLRRDPPPHAVAVLIALGPLYAATMMLIKLSIGPAVLLMFAISLVGARPRVWQFVAFIGLFVVDLLVLWTIAGQDLGDLYAYVENGRQIIAGYSEAMVLSAGSDLQHTIGATAGVVALLALTGGAMVGSYRDNLARWCGVAVALAAGFALFKEGMVRFDPPHLAAYFSTMVVFWMAIPWGGGHRPLALVGALVLFVVAASVQFHKDPGQAFDLLNPVDNVDRAFSETKHLFDADERRQFTESARSLMIAGYGVDSEMLEEMEGHTVAIDPWEIAVAWAYDLDWSPLPVIQNYNVWTAELDRLNAERVASADGPDRILRQNTKVVIGQFPTRTIDDRYPAWDPPGQALATLCNFEPLRTTKGWQLLGRVPDRCAEPKLIDSVESSYGETVTVPEATPGQVVFVRIHGAEVGGLESLRTLLYRAKMRHAVVNGERTYRLVPDTAADGLLLRGEQRLTGSGPFAQAPQARTLELTGLDGDLRYDFFSMTVDGAPGAESGRG
ncbi:MAG: hypothetical protein ABIZ50_06970 [Solirubrobacterales bacterium]